MQLLPDLSFLIQIGKDFSEKTVVCILTGTGLKDPDISAEIEPKSIGEYPADMDSVEKALFIA